VDEVKKSNCTEEQIAFALNQAELGAPVSELCRKLAGWMPEHELVHVSGGRHI